MLPRSAFLHALVGSGALSLLVVSLLFFWLRSTAQTDRDYILKDEHTSLSDILSSSHSSPQVSTDESDKKWEFTVARDGDNYGLSEERCLTAFPKLFVEIDKSVRERTQEPITFQELDSTHAGNGLVRCSIDNGELYVLNFGDQPVTFTRAWASLNSLNRALVAFPDRRSLPRTEFIFSADDVFIGAHGPLWTYSKRDEDKNIWLMPDFGYWSWPEVKVGPYAYTRRRINAIDDGGTLDDEVIDGTRFQDKEKKLLWRGNVQTAPKLRGKLVEMTRDKNWSSVRPLLWGDKENIKQNLLPIEEHCRFAFLAHTEGRSWSGRGKYLLNCRSVLVAHKLIWREAHQAALIASGPEANFVEVERDFSDLEEKIQYLINNPLEAERIANNSVATFRDRYLTPAAEACYWRYLIKQWASVCDFIPTLYREDGSGKKKLKGEPYESWLLKQMKEV